MNSKSKKIAAIVGIVLLVLMYVADLLVAIFCDVDSISIFFAALLSTFFIPTIIYCYTLVMDRIKKNKDENN